MTLESFFYDYYLPLRLINGSPNTLRLYRVTIRKFTQYLRRPPLLSDLNDDTVCRYLQALCQIPDYSKHSVKKERSQIIALWNFAAQKRMVDEFPNVPQVKAPDPIPTAWSVDELNRIASACKWEQRTYNGVPGQLWWFGLPDRDWETFGNSSTILF